MPENKFSHCFPNNPHAETLMVPIFSFRKQTDFSVNSTKNQRNYLKIKHCTSLGYSEGYQSQTAQQMSSLPKECCSCSVTKACLTFYNPMDCSTPGFPVLHYSQSLLNLRSIESMMPSNHLILCTRFYSCPQSFLAPVFSSELVLCIR